MYVSMLEEQDVSLSKYAAPLFILVSCGDTVMQFIMGFTFDRLHVKQRGIAVGTILCCLSLALLMYCHDFTTALIFGFVYGMQDGVLMVGYTTVFSYNFGRVDLGKIDSVAAAVYTLSCGIGPLCFAISKDYTGSYKSVYYGIFVVAAVMSVVLLFEKKPKPPPLDRRLKLDDAYTG